MAANMWKNSLKNAESDNNKILYETLLDFLQRNGTYCLNKPRSTNQVFRKSYLSCTIVICNNALSATEIITGAIGKKTKYVTDTQQRVINI